jgi:Mrp family chromosome partitioning ATPase
MARLFISYARRDGEPLASRLEADLRAAGHEPWRDQREIDAGDAWSREIEEAINACEALIAVLTQGAFESSICRGEQLRALRIGARIVPLLAQPTADRPVYLEGAHYLDFCRDEAYAQRFAELLDHLKRRGGTDRDQLSPRVRALIESDPALGAPVSAAAAGPVDWPALQAAARTQHKRWRDMLAGRALAPGIYEDALYVERGAAQAELQHFAEDGKAGLVLVGEPGVGKTNVLAHWAALREAAGDAVLVYPGERLDAHRLEGEIARDLGFEDANALEPAWPRIEGLLHAAERRLWIVVDGLNDVRASREGARALLMAVDALVCRLPGNAVRVIASCSLGTWQRMDRREPLRLAWGRYYQPGESDVLLLERFASDEVAAAFDRYATRFSLALAIGDLPPEFRARLAEPMLLRLLAECLQGRPAPDAGVDFDTLVFTRYWEQRVRRSDQRALLDELAAEMLARRSASLPMQPLLQHPALGALLADESPDSAYAQLLDDGVLTEVGGQDLFDDARLRFTYPRIGAYAIVRALLRHAGSTPLAVLAAVRDLVAAADEFPLAWEAAITLMAQRGDAAAYAALAGEADAELRELAMESLVRRHGADPDRTRALLTQLLDTGTPEQQRTALRAAFHIGPAARDLLVRGALSPRESLRNAVRDTLYFIWSGASRPAGEARSTALYFVWRRAPDFTRALMDEMAARLDWLRPWEARRILGFLLDLAITIYVNHCDRPDVVEHTAALFHTLTVKRLHLDRIALPAPLERIVLRVVAAVFSERLLHWMLLEDDPRGGNFFALPASDRAAVGEAAAWIDPTSDFAQAAWPVQALLASPVPLLRGVGALVVAVHAVADAPRADPVVRDLFTRLDARGRAWLVAAHAVLLPGSPDWVALLEDLTPRLEGGAVEEAAPPPLLPYFDALHVPLALAYAKRGAGMPLFAPVLENARVQSARACRLIGALGVVGFYHPQPVLELVRPVLPALLEDAATAPATLSALATMRTLHFEAVDNALATAGATDAQRRDVAVLAEPARVQQFMRLLGYYNNAVHYCVHYPRMRRDLGASALQLLATAPNAREFIAGYAAQAIRLARESAFDLRQWTRPD